MDAFMAGFMRNSCCLTFNCGEVFMFRTKTEIIDVTERIFRIVYKKYFFGILYSTIEEFHTH